MLADTPTIHHTEHHGIPVVWADLEGPLTGTLIFGVGARDEPPELLGITHLTEHLLFRSLGSDVVPLHDGITAASTLQFFATGSAIEVATVLNDLADAVDSIPFDDADLMLERRVIEAEHPHRFVPSAGLLTFRYGVGSVGNAHAGSPTLASITSDEVREWIRTWLVTGNAYLIFSGPPPDDLDLKLPVGDIPERRTSSRIVAKPTLIECEKSGVALSLLIAEEESPFLRDALEFELTKELRHRRGLIYSVETEITAVERGLDQVDFVLDPIDEDVPEVINHALATLRRLEQDGIGDMAVRVARSACLQAMASPDVWRAHLESLASVALVGAYHLSIGEYIDRAQGLTKDSLNKALRSARDTLVVAYDEDLELPEDLAGQHGLEVDQFSYWEGTEAAPKTAGPSWRGRRDLSFRDRATFEGDVLWVRLFGEWGRVRLGEVAVVGEHTEGLLSLIDVRGRLFMFDPGDWWRGGSLREAILDWVPTYVRRDFSWHGEDRPARPDIETT